MRITNDNIAIVIIASFDTARLSLQHKDGIPFYLASWLNSFIFSSP